VNVRRLRRRLSIAHINNIVFFLAGLLISAGFELVFRDFVKEYVFIVVILAGVAVAAGVYSLVLTERRIRTSIESMETTVRYIDETYDPARGEEYTGRVYCELEDLVRNAKEEVLRVGVYHDDEYHTSSHPSRLAYLNALERRIQQAEERNEQFTYTRIHQYPKELAAVPMSELLHGKSREHFRKMVDWAPESGESRVYVAIARIQRRMLMPFWIIDGRIVVLEVDAIASDGKPYAAGIVIIDDRGKRLASRFRHYFLMLQRQANPVEPGELAIPASPTPHPASSARS
jgi:hypothetical protein